MTDQRKRLAPQIDRALRHDSAGWQGRLPEDLLQETAQRLALFCGVGAVTWTIAVIMANLLRPTSVPTPFPWPGNLVGGIMIVALAASFFYVKLRAAQGGAPTLDLGLGLLIINAFAIALINEWVPTFPDRRYVSWSTILILVWWEIHLPELTQPLVLAVPATGPIGPEPHLATAKSPAFERMM